MAHQRHLLGKLPPKCDPRTFQMAKYVKPLIPPPPHSTGYCAKVVNWPVLGNDWIDDNTVAAAGHLIQAWSTYAGKPFVPTEHDVLRAYYAIRQSGGATMLDTLNYWRNIGIGGHRIQAFMQFPIQLPNVGWHFKNAVWIFGGAYIGLQLPLSAQIQTGPNMAWVVPSNGITGAGAPGSWGSHCVPALEYDKHGITIITWGDIQRMSWEFLTTYADEAYAILSLDWITSGNVTPAQFDYATLIADLNTV